MAKNATARSSKAATAATEAPAPAKPNNPLPTLGPRAYKDFTEAHDKLSSAGIIAVAALWEGATLGLVPHEDVRDMARKPMPGQDDNETKARRASVTKSILHDVFGIDLDAEEETATGSKKVRKDQAFISLVRNACRVVRDALSMRQGDIEPIEVRYDDQGKLKNVMIINALNVQYADKPDDPNASTLMAYIGSANNKGRSATHTFTALVSGADKRERAASKSANGGRQENTAVTSTLSKLNTAGVKNGLLAMSQFLGSDKINPASMSAELKAELANVRAIISDKLGDGGDSNPDGELVVSIKDATLPQILQAARSELADVETFDREALECIQSLYHVTQEILARHAKRQSEERKAS